MKIKSKKGLFILLFLLIALQYNHSIAQFKTTHASEINVDDLSDAQISKYLERAKESGLSEQQLLVLAKQRGMSEAQIQKLRVRIASGFETQTISALKVDDIDRIREDNQVQSAQGAQSNKMTKIFGANIFQNVDLNFKPSLNAPTPKNYQLGSGDEVIIDIWGASEQSYALTVSPEGLIKVANLGPIHINGLSVNDAALKVKRRLSKIYSGLYSKNGEEPNTYFQLSLGSLRSIKVNVIGEVLHPGSYSLSSFSTIFNALYYAGGPNGNGSMRYVDLIRNGEKIATLDIYDYIIHGKLTSNEILTDQDVILVRPYSNRISVNGQVKRPAIYETMENETLANLIAYAGGFNENAYQANLSIKRNTEKERKVLSIEKSEYSNVTLKNGDQIFVNTIIDRFSNRVQVTGAVNMPGEYELKEGLTLKQLIEQAEGLREDAFTGRGLIVRLNDDLTLSNESFKVSEVISNQSNIILRKEDVVKISSIFDLSQEKTFSIHGEVLKSGVFPYIDGMTVEDLILLSGGLKESASKSTVEVARRIDNDGEDVLLETANTFSFAISDDLRISDEASDFLLEPYDIVTIRATPGFTKQIIVEIEGEVKYPGKYVLQLRNEKISDLIKRAGGLTQFSYPKGAQLIRRTEFYNGNKSDTDDAIRAKKESLVDLADQDILVDKIEVREKETVGIDLVDILANPKSMGDIRLQEGDVVSIPKRLETVRVSGEVLYPITTRYQTQQTFKDYLSYAGGANDQARVKKAFVIYPNGTADRTKGFLWFKNYPKIEPGAEIIIPKKPERQRLSIQEILAITTSLTTIALLIDRLTP